LGWGCEKGTERKKGENERGERVKWKMKEKGERILTKI
jgi:hypothetical protein